MHGILQVRILEWVAFPSQGDLPNPETEPPGLPPALQSDSLQFEPPGKKSLLNGKSSNFVLEIYTVLKCSILYLTNM